MADVATFSRPAAKPASESNAKKVSQAKKHVKILMLHGYTQSGSLFRAKTRALEKMLQKSLAPFHIEPVLFYPTAPNRLRPSDIPGHEPKPSDQGSAIEEEMDAWAWWRSDDASGSYRLLKEGMMAIAVAIQDAGGIDGILGFSQGGAGAALLASAMEQNPEPRPVPPSTAGEHYDRSWVEAVRAANNHRPLRFAVIYSGFFATPKELQWLYQPHIRTPTLQYIGSLDTVVDETRSQALVDRTTNPVVLVHPGGHYVPINKEWVTPLVAFVKHHAVDVAPSDAEPNTKI